MPNRILKESITTSENLNSVSPFDEMFFLHLIVGCDDYGRFDARPRIIAGLLFPLRALTDEQVSESLEHLAGAGLITLYTVQGRRYLCLNSWSRHQNIRAKRSKYPAPSEADEPENAPAAPSEEETGSSVPAPEEKKNASLRAEEKAKTGFMPPDVSEVEKYCRENGLNVKPQVFVDYYTGKGWIHGGGPMRDWKAVARIWSARERMPPSSAAYEQRPADAADTGLSREQLETLRCMQQESYV